MNLHVNVVLVGLDKLLTTNWTRMSVLGLTLMLNSDVSPEQLFVGVHLPTVTALGGVVKAMVPLESSRVFGFEPTNRADEQPGLGIVAG